MKILVADDHESIRNVVIKLATRWGFECVSAANGSEALLELTKKENPPRIAILDWNMPGLTGIEICQALRDRYNGPFIYCIILTARCSNDDLIKALDMGAHDFQSKPLNPAEMKSRILVGSRLIEALDKLDRYAKSMESLAKAKAFQLIETEKKARVDDLTSALSRGYFFESANIEFERCKTDKSTLCIIMFDLDKFKKINDTYGHSVGDLALKKVSKICKTQLRECDMFARYGGDEFIALISEVSAAKCMEIGRRISDTVANSKFKEDIRLTVSYGVSIIGEKDKSLDDIIERADQNLYKMKNSI